MNIKYREKIGLDALRKIVSSVFGVSVADIVSKNRQRPLSEARFAFCYFAKEMDLGTLKSIGLYIGGRDHSTVLHGHRTASDLNQTDKYYRAKLEQVQLHANYLTI